MIIGTLTGSGVVSGLSSVHFLHLNARTYRYYNIVSKYVQKKEGERTVYLRSVQKNG